MFPGSVLCRLLDQGTYFYTCIGIHVASLLLDALRFQDERKYTRRQPLNELTCFTKESGFSYFEDDPPNNNFKVVLDACVLYSQALRDLLLRLALAGFYTARFFERTFEEVLKADRQADFHKADLEFDGVNGLARFLNEDCFDYWYLWAGWGISSKITP